MNFETESALAAASNLECKHVFTNGKWCEYCFCPKAQEFLDEAYQALIEDEPQRLRQELAALKKPQEAQP